MGRGRGMGGGRLEGRCSGARLASSSRQLAASPPPPPVPPSPPSCIILLFCLAKPFFPGGVQLFLTFYLLRISLESDLPHLLLPLRLAD